ncbi:hypothetical protein QN277_007274 [Acacia crassicarpa]|uniref:Uncharacterized protein n=1 Tax=Acacia crassicarpa TaxID=499986 RepID=A0AAE1JR33_9FABA|nr:hypothetical protein QN277_007274 [Acacia crassicarpa]
MGCSQSRLDDEEAVQLCKHRKEFIKQAVQQQTRFASGHTAYIHTLQKVSAALHDYIEEDHEHHEFSGSVAMKLNYLRPSGNPVVSVEERIQSPEMVQVEACSPNIKFGIDGLSVMDSSFCSYYSPNNRPQASQWDFYWNPFSSLDYYGYPTRRNLDQVLMDDETRGGDGIPDLEEDETEPDEFTGKRYFPEEGTDFGINSSMEAAVEEDYYYDEDEVEYSEESHVRSSLDLSNNLATGHVESRDNIMEIDDQDGNEETSGFPVCVDRRPSSMAEVIWDLESQFKVVCNAANDVSHLLQGEKAQYVLNSSSTRDRDKAYDSINDIPEDPSMLSDGSHQSTLERLYEWEKKLYKEVRCGERVRIAYEKNCMLFRDHDVKGDDPSSVDKTRMTIRDLHTKMTVSMHSIDVISNRIETLRDKELHLQLLRLVKGLARMWKVMAECHWAQGRILEEAMTLLPRKQPSISSPFPHRPARLSSYFETELKNWQARFQSWIASLRSYVQALTGWLHSCVRSDATDDASPGRSCDETHPVIGLCVEWSRQLDAIHEASVVEGIDYFTASVRALCAKEGGGGGESVVAERMVEDEIMIICNGMAVAMSSLAEFASDSSKGYDELVKHWGEVK